MKVDSRILRPLLVALLAVGLSACANKGKADREIGGVSDSDSVNGTALGMGTPLPEREEGVSFTGANVDRSHFGPVQFGYDSYAIEPGERAKIERVADFMHSSSKTIILAGFTDERGTPEYNRGLGERRAQAVREALVRSGGDGQRLQTVSFGSEMPAATGSGEAAWSRNRRTEFGIVK